MSHVAALLLSLFTSTAHATEAWPDLSQPAASSRQGAKDAALVIAIEDYFVAQDIPGAIDNGRAWLNWLDDGHGAGMVKPLFNQQATRSTMLTEVARAAAEVQPGGRLWLVYIGHGAPSESGNDGLLVGVDAQQTPASIAERSVSRGELLAAAEAKLPEDASIVMIQDACFSGKTSRGDLVPGMAPLKTVSARLGPRTTVLSAARSDEYAGPLSDGKRPAFSYLVLGALRGWGDRNRDGEVSAAEAVWFADKALVRTTTGRSQTPDMEGPDTALGQSGRERAPDLTALAVMAADTTTAEPALRSAGTAAVHLGGESTDFAALAAAADAADRAEAEAARRAAEAREALEREREQRLWRAAEDVKSAATRDFEAIEGLLDNPTDRSRKVLQAWLERYENAAVEVDGVRRDVEIQGVAAVKRALQTASGKQARNTTRPRLTSQSVQLRSVMLGAFGNDSDSYETITKVADKTDELQRLQATEEQRGYGDPRYSYLIAEAAYDLLEHTGSRRHLKTAQMAYQKVAASTHPTSEEAIRSRYMHLALLFLDEGPSSANVYDELIASLQTYGVNGRRSPYRSNMYIILGEVLFARGDDARAIEALQLAKDDDLNPVFLAMRDLRREQSHFNMASRLGEYSHPDALVHLAQAHIAADNARRTAHGYSMLKDLEAEAIELTHQIERVRR